MYSYSTLKQNLQVNEFTRYYTVFWNLESTEATVKPLFIFLDRFETQYYKLLAKKKKLVIGIVNMGS